MSERETFVIAGGGLAGAKAAETLREEGFEGRVVLVGAEPELPYERPPLSKKYLTGDSPREDAYVHPRSFYDEHEIELEIGVLATELDAAGHRLDLAGGRSLRYDRLLIATGAVPRRPPIEGIDLDGVLVLRTLADADVLRERLGAGARVAIVGAGWIGCEVAASARALDAEVTLLESGATPLERVLGPELGGFYAGVHREHGVDVVTGARVEAIEGDGRVERIRLADGHPVECSTVVVGVGVAPDTRLGVAGGLDVEDGIVVDELLRTSDPDVFAAGDVASAFHPRYGRHVRVEHWANALNQGVAAGRSMLDRGAPYDRLPYFFSDQYDVGMEYAGLHAPGDRLVLRGTLDSRPFRAFWRDGAGRTTAGMHVDDWDAIEEIKRVVESDAAAV
ncbi:MAG TPA: FAD-dependent oxidoreductase [Solirubrobacteraceae bacterium]|nr:FAD-dependent oxidoreductase [Solirubrobacteraceae bacterium]